MEAYYGQRGLVIITQAFFSVQMTNYGLSLLSIFGAADLFLSQGFCLLPIFKHAGTSVLSSPMQVSCGVLRSSIRHIYLTTGHKGKERNPGERGVYGLRNTHTFKKVTQLTSNFQASTFRSFIV